MTRKEEIIQALEKRKRQLSHSDPEQRGFLQRKIEQLQGELDQLEDEPKAFVPTPIDITVDGKKLSFNKAGVANLPYGSLIKRVDLTHYIIMYGSNAGTDAELIFLDGLWQISCCTIKNGPEFSYEELGLAITYTLEKMHEEYRQGKSKPADKPAEQPREVDVYGSIESSLVNDEASTDAELLDFFISLGIGQDEAQFYVDQRPEALLDGINFKLARYQAPDIPTPKAPAPRTKKKSASKSVEENEEIEELRRYLGILAEMKETEKSKLLQKHLNEEMAEIQAMITELEK